MSHISEIIKDKLISTFKSLSKETVPGNGGGWVNLVKFAPALKESGVNFRNLGYNKLGEFIDATLIFESCYDKTPKVPPKFISLKDELLNPKKVTIQTPDIIETDNIAKETKEDNNSPHNPRLSKRDRELFDLLHQEKKDDARTFNKPGYKGIWAGVCGLRLNHFSANLENILGLTSLSR